MPYMENNKICIIIAGSRNEKLTAQRKEIIKGIWIELNGYHLITGDCRGIDKDAHDWGLQNYPLVKRVSMQYAIGPWPAAGPIRNRAMAERADALIAGPGGVGTQRMIEIARERNLIIRRFV